MLVSSCYRWKVCVSLHKMRWQLRCHTYFLKVYCPTSNKCIQKGKLFELIRLLLPRDRKNRLCAPAYIFENIKKQNNTLCFQHTFFRYDVGVPRSLRTRHIHLCFQVIYTLGKSCLSLQTQKYSNLSDLRVRLVSLNMGGIEKHTIMIRARMQQLICVFLVYKG